jgi:hypothetical protein
MPYLYFPIDYVSLRKISEDQYHTFNPRQREWKGFYEIKLPPDAPQSWITSSNRGIIVFSLDPMQPVYQHTIPQPDEVNISIEAFSALGEIEPYNNHQRLGPSKIFSAAAKDSFLTSASLFSINPHEPIYCSDSSISPS